MKQLSTKGGNLMISSKSYHDMIILTPKIDAFMTKAFCSVFFRCQRTITLPCTMTQIIILLTDLSGIYSYKPNNTLLPKASLFCKTEPLLTEVFLRIPS